MENRDDPSDGEASDRAMEEDHDGALEGEAMEGSEMQNPGNPGDHQGVIAPHVGNNSLTLSFQDEVFVFDSVSSEKVQAVLLLLGGRELSAGLTPFSSPPLTPNMAANFPHRVASLMRFREKRKERNFEKKIRYNVRKEVALRMQRNKGQFSSSKLRPEDEAMGPTNWDASQSSGAVEDRPQGASECHHCGISSKSTPLMRRGPDGSRTLCNACGLMWANKGALRDLSKNPSTAIQNVISESTLRGTASDPSPPIENPSNPKEGFSLQENTSEASDVPLLLAAANGHGSS